jgi:hypothetical protein
VADLLHYFPGVDVGSLTLIQATAMLRRSRSYGALA